MGFISSFVDSLAGKGRISYRRGAVFLSATALLLTGDIDQAMWAAVACTFIGGTSAEKLFRRTPDVKA